jgi:hypothetical protein
MSFCGKEHTLLGVYFMMELYLQYTVWHCVCDLFSSVFIAYLSCVPSVIEETTDSYRVLLNHGFLRSKFHGHKCLFGT